MKIRKTSLGWHLTLPKLAWIQRLVLQFAFRVNPMPNNSISDAHTHAKLSWYGTVKAGAKIGKELFIPGDKNTLTLHCIKPNTNHQWVALGEGAKVIDLHWHKPHSFSAT